ncbi:MAG TPA: hypothetical protein VEI57_04455 [Nitrospirota bacterium]|nr:hypothetical protein [Nitrospirota bacterium]
MENKRLKLRHNITKQIFIVITCDTFIDAPYFVFHKWHYDYIDIWAVNGSWRGVTVPYGMLYMKNGFLDEIDDQPTLALFINIGTYFFEPYALEFIKERQRLDMYQLILEIEAQGADWAGVYTQSECGFDIGQWDEYRMSLEELGNV